jgi:hypothetical protein
VDPVPDPLLLRKSGSAGNRTRDLRNSDHWTTEAVIVWELQGSKNEAEKEEQMEVYTGNSR